MHLKYIYFLFLLGLAGVTTSLTAQVSDAHIWVNEFHYDEVTTYGESDENEFIELVVSNQILNNPVEAAKVKLVLYTAGGVGLDADPNLAEGLPYHESSLLYSEAESVHPISNHNTDGSGDNFQRCTPDGANYSFLSKDISGMQDITAGFAVIYGDEVVAQFISYEGTFKACNCPAAGAVAGMTTEEIDAPAENTTTADNHSIYLRATTAGNQYDDFSWSGGLSNNSNTETKCAANIGQEMTDVACIPPTITDPGTLTASCVSTFTLPAIEGVFLSGNEAYFNLPQASGTAIEITTVDEPLVGNSVTVYIYDTNGTDCNAEEIEVTVNFEEGITIDPITEGLVACDELTLPAITGTGVTENAAYFTMSGGMGDRFEVGDVITTSMDLFAYESDENCPAQEEVSFTVNLTPVVNDISNVITCDEFTLPAISGAGNYFTETGGTGMPLSANDQITTPGINTIFIYAEENGCATEESLIIDIKPTPAITRIGDQTACGGFVLPTIEGNNLSGSNVLGYYTASGGPMGGGDKIQTGMTIEENTTLFRYDALGECSDEEEFSITINPLPVFTTNVTPAQCDDSDGTVTVVSTDIATPTFTINWGGGNMGDQDNRTLTGLAEGDYTVTVTDANSCMTVESYTIECNNNDALSVELLIFTAKLSPTNTAILDWTVTNERDFSHFTVLRSTDGKNWSELSEVVAGSADYQYNDRQLLAKFNRGATLYYQLKMVNQDGSFSLSAIRTLVLPTVGDYIDVYPNPATDQATVTVITEQTTAAQLRVLSINGKLLQQFTVENPAAAQQQTLDLATLPAGVYFVQLHLTNGIHQQKVIVE